ncbi:hypothetical protein FZEAL_3186 [Fusarium zealandicum]|uniref:Cell wall protein n=1 Tax=Fusarium zealandicum TaxID=1053134 RepID=A0A8H4XN60_9HYPO|nr:hypothetical protein FZEAL_3186 [Fusarium zealandicum]
MAVFKIKTLASALAVLGVFATGAAAEAALSAETSTDAPVTQQHGSTTSDGMLLYTMSICTITHQTECSMVMSTGGEVPPPAETNEPSVPAEGEPTTYHGEGETFPGEGYPEPSETGPHATVLTGSQPGYTAPGATAPGESGEPGESVPAPSGVPVPVPSGEPVPAPSGEPVPVPSVISTTDASGNPTVLTTAYDEPSGTAVTDTVTDTATDTASGSLTDAYPSSTGEIDETAVTGTPTVTATGAGTMPTAAPAAVFGLAGMLAAIVI